LGTKEDEMKEMIYYPGFEVEDEAWLKFALLYLDKLNPIIPYSGDIYLSDTHRMVADGTDLISPHRPDYEEGDNATRDALEKIESILEHPERYERIFGSPATFVNRWRHRGNQTHTLFRDKYTDLWERFCLDSKPGYRSNQGINLSPEVTYLYMTILAQAISDSKEIESITDNKALNAFSIFTHRTQQLQSNHLQAAQAIINLKIPVNIQHINLKTIIAHRNKADFRMKQKAFQEELSKYLQTVESGNSPERFAESLGSLWNDFSDDIATLSTNTASFGLAVWLLSSSLTTGVLETAKEFSGGLALTVGSTISIRNTWKHTKTRRLTRKYLADLNRINR
jgi:hypothetical protein